MAALSMSQLATREVANPAAVNSGQLRHRSASGKSDRVRADQRALRVLVVDDEQNVADAIVGQVRRSGHTARVAYDGLAALRAAAAQDPDVVLLDMKMPFMDGGQVAMHLRLDFPRKERFIIAVTERADDVSRQQCLEAGIDLALSKPVDPSILETLILLECVLVNRRQARRARGFLNCPK